MLLFDDGTDVDLPDGMESRSLRTPFYAASRKLRRSW